MTEPVALHAQRHRANSFGSVASEYDRCRPRYPDHVADEIAALANSGYALDVGAGTGIATQQLRDRGVRALALEPDTEMAAIAAAKGLDVELGTFETWDPAGRTFDLILFAQSFHWVDATTAARRAFSLLNPGGALALLWHMTSPQGPSQDEFDAVYGRYTQQKVGGSSTTQQSLTETLETAGFVVSDKTYPVRTEYSTADWLDLVFTYSAQIVLRPDAAQSLRSDLAELVGPDGVTVVGSAYLALAIKPSN